MEYDVILIHPPAIYDFRKKPIFSGALGSTEERVQFIKIPIGMLSIADYLDRHGYKVVVDNLADRMVSSQAFNAEEHIKNSSARIYAIGLHWHNHSQGAIEVAKLCKELHPGSLVILGGLTATYFHKEIIHKSEFVDAVIRGEAEKPFLQFIRAFEKHGKLTATPNLTYRTDTGEICVTPIMKPSENLDEFEFIRFDLLEPKTSIFSTGPRWGLTICRGCIYNCVTCGGSAYSYRKYLGREKPAFRSPEKIIEDIKQLSEQGIRFISLYQDLRMAGEKYWKKLITMLRREELDIEGFSIDLFTPADEEFIREVATIGKQVKFFICPDSGRYEVRRLQGRYYSNEDLLNTAKICYKYHIPITFFFSLGLAGETPETARETRELIENICLLQQDEIVNGNSGDIEHNIPVEVPIIGPIIIDPGSLAYDSPNKYGYKLTFNNFEEYIKGLSAPSWHQWLNHETITLNKDAFIELIFESIEYSIRQKEKYGMYSNLQARLDLLLTKADRRAVDEVNHIMNIPDTVVRESKLHSVKHELNSLDSYFGSLLRAPDLY